MKLTFKSSHLSILTFPTIELPDFTLITGLNGTGKSHLLQAIAAGKVVADNVGDHRNEIRLFDWTTMVPKDTGGFSSSTLTEERLNLFRQFEALAAEGREKVDSAARSLGVTGPEAANLTQFLALNVSELSELVGSEELGKAAKTGIDRAVLQASQRLLAKLPANSDARDQIASIAKNSGRPIIALTKEDFLSGHVPSWGTASAFQQSFARLFVAYRDIALKNSIKQLQKHKGRPGVECLTDEEFVRDHMVAPWVFVNQAIRDAGLDFEINHPDEYDLSSYEPRLMKLSSKAEMKFSDLSSGEKILMSFALCLYYAQDRRQVATYPKILLLDEVDAPLHPSMSRNLIETICNILVGKHGIKVIATTHSPSTVALAPAQSLHAMRSGEPGLHKISKSQALNILTVGVPTLSLSYEGRRQVFVESSVDAQIYGMIYEILKSRISSERSLQFLETGIKSKSGELNSGCDAVKSVVSKLSTAGNNSVFGLIDWDKKHVSTNRVFVLAEGRRDGLENAILDPLLIASALAREGHLPEPFKYSYFEFLNLPKDELQLVVDSVQKHVLGQEAVDKIEASYQGDFALHLDRAYLHTDDHNLKSKIREAFKPLNKFDPSPGLMRHVTSTVMRDKPEYIPVDFFEVFNNLLACESHIEELIISSTLPSASSDPSQSKAP